jgi:hypothetical protein
MRLQAGRINMNGKTVVVIDAGVSAEQANAVLLALTNPFPTGSVLPIDGGALLM